MWDAAIKTLGQSLLDLAILHCVARGCIERETWGRWGGGQLLNTWVPREQLNRKAVGSRFIRLPGLSIRVGDKIAAFSETLPFRGWE